MSIVVLTKWGNSVGIRVPTVALKSIEAHVGEQFELSVTKEGGLLLKPIKDRQEGWLEAFNRVADKEKPFFDNIANNFDKDEWTW